MAQEAAMREHSHLGPAITLHPYGCPIELNNVLVSSIWTRATSITARPEKGASQSREDQSRSVLR